MAKLLYDCPMYGFKAGDEVEVKYEKDNKMTNYEFHVGDVVEATGYKLGVVYNVGFCDVDSISCLKKVEVYYYTTGRIETFIFGESQCKYYNSFGGKFYDFCKYFKRIGKYTFSPTKPEKKNKIEPLEPIENGFTASTHLFQKVIVNKLNEIIACINKQEE